MEFEEQLERLRKINEQLEKGSVSLEKSLELYKEGVALAAGCRRLLEQAGHTVRIYAGEDLQDFSPSALPEAGDESGAGL
ncbi:MAG: exodeoxyribonuclease VII small subunit [Deltaproteobacteria bacterium]|jgi:exodeoxyribonuclease VII small subunit|nr:exodeoxyribonuclease VII small subunit [Deltaproteobacteria bacterium]